MSHGFSFLPTFAIGLHQRRHERLEFIPFGLREVGLLILRVDRSEEHTSELQSPCNFVCSLLLEKEMDFHAWLNPYHAEFRIVDYSISPTHITKLHPDWFVPYGSIKLFDPGNIEFF